MLLLLLIILPNLHFSLLFAARILTSASKNRGNKKVPASNSEELALGGFNVES